ncbi:hypothetical protein DFH09DRAFT_1088994 [Mycena vulgaris]|nr:hypothetical protein DFH09DRAFT_1090906 [Mycena vulgaris]KAJ6542444.1 hypothetical protein DFH09DRAFT_1088994 [Mycena vulgaris]
MAQEGHRPDVAPRLELPGVPKVEFPDNHEQESEHIGLGALRRMRCLRLCVDVGAVVAVEAKWNKVALEQWKTKKRASRDRRVELPHPSSKLEYFHINKFSKTAISTVEKQLRTRLHFTAPCLTVLDNKMFSMLGILRVYPTGLGTRGCIEDPRVTRTGFRPDPYAVTVFAGTGTALVPLVRARSTGGPDEREGGKIACGARRKNACGACRGDLLASGSQGPALDPPTVPSRYLPV